MSRSFNGSTGFIITASGAQFPQSALTVTAWIYWTSAATVVIVAAHDAGVILQSYLQFFIVSDGTLTGRIKQDLGTNWIGRSSNASTVALNGWHHVAMVWDGGTTNAAIKSYYDGTRVDTTNSGAGTFSAPYSGTALPFEIGSQSQGTSNLWFGRMADVALYSVALTAGEIKGLSLGVRPRQIRPVNIFRYYPLDGIQSPEPDLSGKRFNGTLTGTALAFGPPFTMFTPRWPQKIETAVAAAATPFVFTPAIIP